MPNSIYFPGLYCSSLMIKLKTIAAIHKITESRKKF